MEKMTYDRNITPLTNNTKRRKITSEEEEAAREAIVEFLSRIEKLKNDYREFCKKARNPAHALQHANSLLLQWQGAATRAEKESTLPLQEQLATQDAIIKQSRHDFDELQKKFVKLQKKYEDEKKSCVHYDEMYKTLLSHLDVPVTSVPSTNQFTQSSSFWQYQIPPHSAPQKISPPPIEAIIKVEEYDPISNTEQLIWNGLKIKFASSTHLNTFLKDFKERFKDATITLLRDSNMCLNVGYQMHTPIAACCQRTPKLMGELLWNELNRYYNFKDVHVVSSINTSTELLQSYRTLRS